MLAISLKSIISDSYKGKQVIWGPTGINKETEICVEYIPTRFQHGLPVHHIESHEYSQIGPNTKLMISLVLLDHGLSMVVLLLPGPFGAPLEMNNCLNTFVVMKNVYITKLYYLSP